MKNAILAYALLIGIYANAQKDSLTARNTIYLEAGGNSYLASLSYERLFRIKNQRFFASVGLLMNPVRVKGIPKTNSDIMYSFLIPFQIGYLYGKKKQYEAGVGLVFVNSSHIPDYWLYYVDANQDYMLSIKILGYRFQKKEGGGIFGRINLNYNYTFKTSSPYGSDNHINFFWPGASIGYTFKSRKR
jgi:hypothetical protein